MTTDINIMNLKVGGKKQVGKIINIRHFKIEDRNGYSLPKIILTVLTETNEFKVDEAWVYNKDNILKPQGLWLKFDAERNINSVSTLAKVLRWFKAQTISDLEDQEIELYPKPNGFLAVIACENQMFQE